MKIIGRLKCLGHVRHVTTFQRKFTLSEIATQRPPSERVVVNKFSPILLSHQVLLGFKGEMNLFGLKYPLFKA